MKTTIEIGDDLLARAKLVGAEQATTLRDLVEAGLRRELEARTGAADYKLSDASFDGNGLASDFADAGWERIRDAAYSGRGS